MHEPDAPAWASEWRMRREEKMNLDNKIARVERAITLKKVTLNELIIALNVIDHQIVHVRTELEAYEEYLEVLKDERRR